MMLFEPVNDFRRSGNELAATAQCGCLRLAADAFHHRQVWARQLRMAQMRDFLEVERPAGFFVVVREAEMEQLRHAGTGFLVRHAESPCQPAASADGFGHTSALWETPYSSGYGH